MKKLLKLNDWRIKAIIKKLGLTSKKVIGRGVFSIVFEGSKPNTVLKLTIDDIGYALFNDWVAGIKHHLHFPKVIKDFGAVGAIKIRGEEYPLFLFEIERLLPLTTESKKLARKIIKLCAFQQEITEAMLLDIGIPKSIRNALRKVQEFCYLIPGGMLDMHSGNFMQRKNGTLLMIDPIAGEHIRKVALKLY